MICIPIVARTNEAALAQMEKSSLLADILELRIDQIRDVDLKQLMNGKQTKILITNRRGDEGGGFAGTERERIELLKDAVALGADYVDIEARTEKPLLRELAAQIERYHARTKWIISYHDMSGTPSERTLQKKFDVCSRIGADIVKICTLAHAMEDNLRVLRLIPYARDKGQAIIALCMGEQGRISRVMAPLLGSSWSYASLEKGAESASGQLTIEEMKQIHKILSGAGIAER
ncbi:MAG: type I 3-dehydroquinate dehydratase [Deltaproteobacteria bacterium RBG_13_52_11]|nr:MAG: type I 3-dehydroquinate dehydratase [Deltaproteobacteria bacterium RBG_13_52_11]